MSPLNKRSIPVSAFDRKPARNTIEVTPQKNKKSSISASTAFMILFLLTTAVGSGYYLVNFLKEKSKIAKEQGMDISEQDLLSMARDSLWKQVASHAMSCSTNDKRGEFCFAWNNMIFNETWAKRWHIYWTWPNNVYGRWWKPVVEWEFLDENRDYYNNDTDYQLLLDELKSGDWIYIHNGNKWDDYGDHSVIFLGWNKDKWRPYADVTWLPDGWNAPPVLYTVNLSLPSSKKSKLYGEPLNRVRRIYRPTLDSIPFDIEYDIRHNWKPGDENNKPKYDNKIEKGLIYNRGLDQDYLNLQQTRNFLYANLDQWQRHTNSRLWEFKNDTHIHKYTNNVTNECN